MGQNTRLFVSGDSGYGPHYKEIGQKYGPFDIALIDGGQYDDGWPDIHLTPEQAVQAHRDVNGRAMMLTHWGAFTLANHGWKEPIERALQEADKLEVNLITPPISETVILEPDLRRRASAWWED